MARTNRFTVQQVLDAVPKTGGIMALVAKKLECDRSTVWHYAQRYVTVARALEQADEELTDLAEAKAGKMIEEGYWPAIEHRLSTKGKRRGYTERIEMTGADSGPVAVVIAKDGIYSMDAEAGPSV